MLNFLKKLIPADNKKIVKLETQKKIIHLAPDNNLWGYAINWRNWNTRRVSGHFTPYIRNGDIFGYRMASGKIGIFRLIDVENCRDPRDMFFATAEDIGYAEDYPGYL